MRVVESSVRSSRDFLIIDALALTAATAVGIAGTLHARASWGYAWFWNLAEGWSVGATLRRLMTLGALLLPGLAAWTATVLAARFIPPRPSLRRIALQPGSAACGVALLVLIVETVGQVVSVVCFEYSRGYLGAEWKVFGFAGWWHTDVLLKILGPIAFAIAAAWTVLLVSRLGRPESSWIDRVGRALGACWIAMAFLFWLNHEFLGGRLPGALQ